MPSSIIAFVLFFFSSIPFYTSAGNDASQEAFRAAQRVENEEGFEKAMPLYAEISQKYRGHRYAGEALFKLAFFADEKQRNPPIAIGYYEQYVRLYTSRHTRRAELRIEHLAKYQNADVEKYREYLSILELDTPGSRQAMRARMQRFVSENPGLPFLDDALFWLANETKGFSRETEIDPLQHSRIDRAIVLYRRLLADYPRSNHRLTAMKNLGDCYLLKQEYTRAEELYRAVKEEGAEYGEIIVGQAPMVSRIHAYRTRVVGALKILIPVLLALLVFIVPFRLATWMGLRRGLFHAALLFPPAAGLFALTFFLTDPTKDNIRGEEPYLMLVLMVSMLAGTVLSGVVADIHARRTLSLPAYSVVLFLLQGAVVFIGLYLFNLLPHVERLLV